MHDDARARVLFHGFARPHNHTWRPGHIIAEIRLDRAPGDEARFDPSAVMEVIRRYAALRPSHELSFHQEYSDANPEHCTGVVLVWAPERARDYMPRAIVVDLARQLEPIFHPSKERAR